MAQDAHRRFTPTVERQSKKGGVIGKEEPNRQRAWCSIYDRKKDGGVRPGGIPFFSLLFLLPQDKVHVSGNGRETNRRAGKEENRNSPTPTSSFLLDGPCRPFDTLERERNLGHSTHTTSRFVFSPVTGSRGEIYNIRTFFFVPPPLSLFWSFPIVFVPSSSEISKELREERTRLSEVVGFRKIKKTIDPELLSKSIEFHGATRAWESRSWHSQE
jgi:hypothetical protein